MNFERQLDLLIKDNRQSLSLGNWDESEHPRDHGKFSSGGGGGGGGNEESDYGYDREAIRAKIRAEDSSKKLGKFLSAFKLAAYAGGTYALVKSGHPILAAALVGGAAATTYRHAIFHEAPRISAKYALKTAGLAAKVATAPVWIPLKVANAGARGIARGIKEGVGLSLEQRIFEISLEFSIKPELLLAKYDANLHPKDKLGRWAKKGTEAGTIHGNQMRPGRLKKSKQRFEIEPGETEGQGYKKQLENKKLERNFLKEVREKKKKEKQLTESARWEKLAQQLKGNSSSKEPHGFREYSEAAKRGDLDEYVESATPNINPVMDVAKETAINVGVSEGTSFLGRKIFKGVQSALAKFGIGGKKAATAPHGGNWPSSMHDRKGKSIHIGGTSSTFTEYKSPHTTTPSSNSGLIRSGANATGSFIKSGAKYIRKNPKKAIATAILTYAGYKVGSRYYGDYKKRKQAENEEKEEREFHEELKKQTSKEIARNAAIYANQQYIKEATATARQNAALETERFKGAIDKNTREIAHRATRDFVNYQRRDLDREVTGERDPNLWEKIFGRKKKEDSNYSIAKETKRIAAEVHKFI